MIDHNQLCTCGCDETDHVRIVYSRFVCIRCDCVNYVAASTELELIDSRIHSLLAERDRIVAATKPIEPAMPEYCACGHTVDMHAGGHECWTDGCRCDSFLFVSSTRRITLDEM
jgi:hypothetical protein